MGEERTRNRQMEVERAQVEGSVRDKAVGATKGKGLRGQELQVPISRILLGAGFLSEPGNEPFPERGILWAGGLKDSRAGTTLA